MADPQQWHPQRGEESRPVSDDVRKPSRSRAGWYVLALLLLLGLLVATVLFGG